MSSKGSEPSKTESIFKVLDELIYHLNTTRNTFNFLIISSFILAPLALVVAGIFVLHPRLLVFMLERVPQVGTIIIVFVTISVLLASIWLAIGIKERAFFSAWNRRFNRFASLREKIDKELED
jgi:hypothetical protein